MIKRATTFSGWANVLRQGLAAVFQTRCPLCDRPAIQVFCADCTRRLQACQCAALTPQAAGLPSLYCWGRYEGALKQSLARLKYDHRPEISEPLGQWLAQGWLAQSQSPHLRVIAVPIPLHGDREQQRGYNQAELIARSFCQITGIPLKAKGLLRTQATTAQHSLSRQARFQNLSSVFSLGPDLQNSTKQRQIILIDDIFTTGATLKAATDLLHKVKFQVAGLLSVAITERQQPPQYCSDKTQTQCTRPLNLRHFPQVGASAHGSGFPILEDFAPQPPPELGGRGAECVVHH